MASTFRTPAMVFTSTGKKAPSEMRRNAGGIFPARERPSHTRRTSAGTTIDFARRLYPLRMALPRAGGEPRLLDCELRLRLLQEVELHPVDRPGRVLQPSDAVLPHHVGRGLDVLDGEVVREAGVGHGVFVLLIRELSLEELLAHILLGQL